MKIVNLVTQEEAGGAQYIAFQVAEGLRDKGYDSSLVFLYTKRRVPEYEGRSISMLNRPYQGLRDLLGIGRRLLLYLREEKPDVVICHTRLSNFFGGFIAKFAGVSCVIPVHHTPIDTYSEGSKLLDRLFDFLKIYSSHITVSEAVYHSFMETYKGRMSRRVKLVRNGIQSPPSTIEPYNLRIPNDVRVIVNVGRLSRVKNQHVLFSLIKELQNTHLVLVGDGELKTYLTECAENLGVSNRVHFVGEKTRNEVWSLLKRADVFVFPSIFEAMGLALVEAMSVEIPIIASEMPATRALLGHGERRAGILVEANDVQAMISAVKFIEEYPEKTREMVADALEVSKEYCTSKMVDQYESVICELLGVERK
ncbi:MAG: glycosyltransferase family 4 protein [Pontiella sp.]